MECVDLFTFSFATLALGARLYCVLLTVVKMSWTAPCCVHCTTMTNITLNNFAFTTHLHWVPWSMKFRIIWHFINLIRCKSVVNTYVKMRIFSVESHPFAFGGGLSLRTFLIVLCPTEKNPLWCRQRRRVPPRCL